MHRISTISDILRQEVDSLAQWLEHWISTPAVRVRISDILRQEVDSLAQWLEHWISTPAVRVRIPSGTLDFFFQAMHHLLITNFHIRKMGARPGWTI